MAANVHGQCVSWPGIPSVTISQTNAGPCTKSRCLHVQDRKIEAIQTKGSITGAITTRETFILATTAGGGGLAPTTGSSYIFHILVPLGPNKALPVLTVGGQARTHVNGSQHMHQAPLRMDVGQRGLLYFLDNRACTSTCATQIVPPTGALLVNHSDWPAQESSLSCLGRMNVQLGLTLTLECS